LTCKDNIEVGMRFITTIPIHLCFREIDKKAGCSLINFVRPTVYEGLETLSLRA
jgi:hypothetical protein